MYMNITVKMLSKVAFASLAFACVDAAYAAEIDTTGTTVTLSPQNRYIGNGTLQVSGGGAVWLGGSGSDPYTEFAMTGGVIDIVSGTTLMNGGWGKGKWGENKAGLQVNGTLDLKNGEWVCADALTGSGAVTMTFFDGWNTSGLVLGLNNGGGTFTGTITDSNNGMDNIQLHKYGTGTQILIGMNNYSSSTIIGGGTLAVSGALTSSEVTVQTGAAFAAGSTGVVGRATLGRMGRTLRFLDTSRLLVDVTATEADVVEVAGDVEITGTVTLEVSGDQTRGGSWKVLESTGGTITGDFVLAGARNGSFLKKSVGNKEIWLTIPPPMGTLIRFL
jgi:hypothetical protein